MHFGAQQLHQHHTHNCHRHGDGANDLYAIFLFGDQGEHGECPHETEQHFVNTGKRCVSRFVPAMDNGCGIGDQSQPGGERCELHIGLGAGDSKSEIQRASASVENQSGEQEIRLIQKIAALHHVQKCHEQQKRDGQSDHHDQGHAGCRLLLFCFCACH